MDTRFLYLCLNFSWTSCRCPQWSIEWNAFAADDLDTLVADYTEDVIFIMPGQAYLAEGIPEFRAALENFGAAAPAGFEADGQAVPVPIVPVHLPAWCLKDRPRRAVPPS
jgi:hypothetical protein